MPVLGSVFFEYKRYSPDFNFRIISASRVTGEFGKDQSMEREDNRVFRLCFGVQQPKRVHGVRVPDSEPYSIGESEGWIGASGIIADDDRLDAIGVESGLCDVR